MLSPGLAEYRAAGRPAQRGGRPAQPAAGAAATGPGPAAEWRAAAKLQLDAAQKPVGQAELAIIGAARRLVSAP
ncbi:MAG: hypothetical protein WKG07_13910 [Hymenobacter sp.]